ncbi:hypothetical protein AB0L05_27990 [Nonomuraea pusilla]|uniref:hypothetical protein n=1 Tax=Nonomuraea pusilla TaxID=46177 RepID=UPI003326F5F1
MDVVTSPSSSLDNLNHDTGGQEESLLDRLRRRALCNVRPSPRERVLIKMLTRTSSHPIHPPSALATPIEFREALRRPKGSQHHLVVHIGGRPHGLVLNAQGTADPAREDILWHWLVTRVQTRGAE